MAKDYLAQLVEMAQPHCDEPVVAAAGIMPRGMTGGILLHKVSPAAGWARQGQARAENPDLPKSAMLAVTEHHVYLLATAIKGRSSKVTGVVRRWDRDDVHASATPARTTVAIDLQVQSTGEAYTLESVTMRGGDGPANALVAALTSS